MIEPVDLNFEEPYSKKVKLDPEAATMKTHSKGKEIPKKSKEDKQREAFEQCESIEEAHIQHKREIGMGVSQGTNASTHQQA